MEQQEKTPASRRLKIIIIILAVLLVLSAGALAARMIYLYFFDVAQTTVAVPDNLIGDDTNQSEGDTAIGQSKNNALTGSNTESQDPAIGESDSIQDEESITGESGSVEIDEAVDDARADKPTQATTLELYQGKPGDNQKFEVQNMLPGDSESRYFCIRVYHDKDIELFFKADITEQTKALGEVLHIKVTHLESGKVLCDAPFNEVNGKAFSELLKSNSKTTTTAYYQIDVSLDTSVGNEYQAARLLADFEWSVKDGGGLTTPAKTGDNTNLVLWIVLAGSSLLLVALLWKRRKEDGQHERI